MTSIGALPRKSKKGAGRYEVAGKRTKDDCEQGTRTETARRVTAMWWPQERPRRIEGAGVGEWEISRNGAMLSGSGGEGFSKVSKVVACELGRECLTTPVRLGA